MKSPLLILSLLFLSYTLTAQEEPKKYEITGYVKDLQTVFLFHQEVPSINLDTTVIGMSNFLHNRINFKWYPNEVFTVKADLRTRLFWGDDLNNAFIESLDGANDFFDLSIGDTYLNRLAYHSMIDRLYLEYNKGNWAITLGRQRVNWGINTVWNPNDIFNAFAFTDFDYEERPGSDALRVKYYTGYASSIEVAVKAFDEWEEAVAAGLVKFNKWNYDFQVLGGVVQEEVVVGGGWAGNIKSAGFKGEFSYFIPFDGDEDQSFAATLAFDYITKSTLYLNTGFLFNSNGADRQITDLFAFELSAKNLYPYTYSIFASAGYPFTPLVNANFAIIYSPSEAHALFLNPGFTYSIAENWDLDLIGQIGFDKGESYRSPVQALFLRVKFSY